MTPLKFCTCTHPSQQPHPPRYPRLHPSYPPFVDRKIPRPQQHLEKICGQHNYSTEEGCNSDGDSLELSISECEIKNHFATLPRLAKVPPNRSKKTNSNIKVLFRAITSQIEQNEVFPIESPQDIPIKHPTASISLKYFPSSSPLNHEPPIPNHSFLIHECEISKIEESQQPHWLQLAEPFEQQLQQELLRGLIEQNKHLKDQLQRLRLENQKKQSKNL